MTGLRCAAPLANKEVTMVKVWISLRFLYNDLVIGEDEDAEEVLVDDESRISALKQLVLAQFGLKCSVHEMKVYDLENETVRLMNAMKVLFHKGWY